MSFDLSRISLLKTLTRQHLFLEYQILFQWFVCWVHFPDLRLILLFICHFEATFNLFSKIFCTLVICMMNWQIFLWEIGKYFIKCWNLLLIFYFFQAQQFISLIDTYSNQLNQKDFNQSCKIWSGFDIVAQMVNIDIGPKDYNFILVSSILLILHLV